MLSPDLIFATVVVVVVVSAATVVASWALEGALVAVGKVVAFIVAISAAGVLDSCCPRSTRAAAVVSFDASSVVTEAMVVVDAIVVSLGTIVVVVGAVVVVDVVLI